ncbi:MAG TPA: hypothetical protein DCX89_05895 [Saprospirales bacterium]|nr:hypothetical protein [Saprospirales bacterium]HAY71405.1 hypothetical protein [Saprospirales bacterium]HRQ30400.1 hypothetical protein [Saprospiraceae bacterium]
MSVLDQVRIVFYRCHEKGLEILLIKNELENDPNVWKLPKSELKLKLGMALSEAGYHYIELDDITDASGRIVHTYAIEGDLKDVPSIRGLIKHDMKLIKAKVKETFPELEKGSFFAIKEAFKKVMPNEYAALKELKEILWDRNVISNI